MSEPRRQRERVGAQFLLTAACAVVLVAGLKAAASLMVPFLGALFLALVSLPVFGALVRLRVPRGLAVLLTVILDITVLGAVVMVAAAALRDALELLPLYQQRLREVDLQIDTLLAARGLPPIDLLGDPNLGPAALGNLVEGLLRRIVAVSSNALLVLFTTAFMLLEAAGFPAKFSAAFGGSGMNLEQLAHARAQIQRYLVVKTVASATTGVLIGGWAAACGLAAPVLWGLLAFALNYVPTLGSILAAIPAILAAWVQGGTAVALAVALGYVLVNVAIGNIAEPLVLGRRLGLSTLVVFSSLMFWGWVWGPVGALLAVPLTTVVKILLENTRDLRPIAILLGARPPQAPAA